ncbi:amidohydrolase family protein [Granulicella tundricola]|uniref:Amidohydrolase 2 n=1 Tax=Granulicella tundricola (strain ATCC BAA-1859 / DSM 23138 / MP5ACTX9) TaxID=1198114 RepID=E8X6C3_GRATM|nr:amidohydrolase family protein [Granulicella tundricola]ADW71007.1 amidohydrolase 2 [Granulicella tundricola MP5ACTX9]
MRTITLEEHFVTDSFLRATGAYDKPAPPWLAQLQPKLLDLGDGRIAAMDEAGIDLQVLSLAALGFDALDAATATPLVHDINDELAAAVRANPTRLAAFASLALKDPQSAARELERAIQKLGFRGVLLDGTTDGLFLDDPRFTPVFEAAVALNVPIYLHPAPPPESVFDTYFTGLPEGVGQMLSIAGWGWHAETALHTLRLITNGVFDRYPTLQLIIGHMGEMLPMALARTSKALSHAARLRQPVAAYFQSNIHLTTSGYFTQPPLRCALDVVGIDRLMFSIDYPFSANTLGRDYLTELEQTLTPEDLAKLIHRNAESLLNLS